MEIERINIILPGEQLCPNFEDYQLSKQFSLSLDFQIFANQYGQVIQKQQKKIQQFAIANDPKKYFPEKEDFVIGVVKQKLAEFYIVDIGGAQDAILGIYEFLGATKKNRPMIQIGQNIYCRVMETNKYTKPKLSCISQTNKKEWMTGEAFFGELKKGLLSKISIAFARQLLSNETSILKEIQQYCSFEAAVGINGKLWVQANDFNNTILVTNAIIKSKNKNVQEIESFVKQISEYMTKK